MGNEKVTADNLGKKILSTAKTSLGNKVNEVRQYLEAESEKLAITLQGVAEGSISNAEAKILLDQQKIAAASVLTASEGMAVVAAQAAINAALAVVKEFVNGKIGFALL